MFKKILSLFIVVLVVVSALSCTASAASSLFAPYKSYEYNEFDEAIVSPISYTLKETIDTAALGLEVEIQAPNAVKYINDTIYILDSGNSRILALNTKYELVAEYKNFTIDAEYAEKNNVILDKDGFVSFVNAGGFDVTEKEEFIIADTSGNRVLRAGFDCKVKSVIYCPEDALNDTDANFGPRAVIVDDRGRLYVSSNNIALGLFIFDENEQFVEFFGANEVLSTTQALVKFIRELFFTITQMESVEQATPVTIINMDFAEGGFMYTVSPYRDAESAKKAVEGLVRKLNYYGDDLYAESVVFGDIEESSDGVLKTWFEDVDVDEDGFINLLDPNHGRVFQYTDTGTLIAVFGANGDQAGCFSNAKGIETIGSDVLVIDNKKNCLFVFEATEYTKAVRSAVIKMNNNDLEGSTAEWEALLRSNSNSSLCYQGLGRIADYNGDYTAAMDYFKRAYNQEEYALAFQQQRQIFIQDNAVWVVLGIIVLIVLVMIGLKALGKLAVPAEGQAYSRLESKHLMPLYVLTHPIDGFAQFKVRKNTSMLMAAIIAISWLVIKVLEYNFTGFAFEINRDVDFNMPVTMLLTVGLYLMFCIANWAICTLFDGKGTIKDILATTAYSLIPYIVCLAIRIVLTNVLVPTESVFIEIIMVIGIIWSAGVLILGMLTIHDFSVLKTIGTIILTLIGIVAIVFLVIMLYSLLKQMFSFFVSLYKEIDFRYL